MLTETEHKDVRSKKSVKIPLKNVFMSAAYSEIFSGRGTHLDIFSIVVFSGGIILKHIEKKGSRGSAGMLLQKIFENLHTAVAF